MTGNMPRLNGETVTCHPRFWLLRALPFAPGSNRVTAGLLRLRQDTPPNAYARDSLLVADVLARGSLPSATFPGFQDPSGHAGRTLAAYSCGGSRGITCFSSTCTAFPFDPLREPPLMILKTVPRAVKRRCAEFFGV